MRKIWGCVSSVLAISLAFLLAAHAAVAQQSDLDVAIRAVENGVEFTLINTGQSSISFLSWETPLEAELTQDVFLVTPADGSNPDLHAPAATFSGRLFKRGDPQPSDFINIAAGETITSFVPLADYYQLKNSGGHHVSFNGVFQFESKQEQGAAFSMDRSLLSHQHLHDNLNAVAMSTGTVSVDLTPVPEVLYAQAAGYSSCSASQQADLSLDFDASEVITREARQALENLPENERAGSPRYLKWFGTYDSNRYASVLNTYQQAEALMAAGEIEFACDCDEPYFAFIRRTEPFKVNLCTYYWRAARTGTDSRAGTILHEVSHFNEVGGTSDFAYGANEVSQLAETNPVRAVANADSIEYFAENTPFVEISGGVVTQEEVVIPTLAYTSPVSGAVVLNGGETYQVAGADSIQLTTLTGDADLYLFSDVGLTNQICQSRSAGSLDTCEIDTIDVVYVYVIGYEASTYSIAALQYSVDFQVGQTETFDIGESEQQHFAVTGASFIQVESVSGDADLYVYSSAARDASVLECNSRNISSNSTIDLCEVNGTAYISVYSLQAGQYTLSAFSSDPRVPEVIAEPVLQAGERVTSAINVSDQQYYTVYGANFVQVESLSGDVDIYVFSSPERIDNSLVCISNNFSGSSLLDTCAINGTAYVTVFGVDAGQYTIAALMQDPAAQVEVADPDTGDNTPGDNTTVDDSTTGNSGNTSNNGDTDTSVDTQVTVEEGPVTTVSPDEGVEPVVNTETGSTTNTSPDTNNQTNSNTNTDTSTESESVTSIGANDPTSNSNGNNSNDGGGSFGTSLFALLVLLMFGRRTSMRGVIR